MGVIKANKRQLGGALDRAEHGGRVHIQPGALRAFREKRSHGHGVSREAEEEALLMFTIPGMQR